MEEELVSEAIPFTKNLLKGVSGLFTGKKSKYVMAGLGAAGFASARPFKGAYTKIVNEGVLGNPRGTQQAIDAGVGEGLGMSDMDYEAANNPANRAVNGGPAGPNGDIVFGLYNLRA